jgi:hypothetical protein
MRRLPLFLMFAVGLSGAAEAQNPSIGATAADFPANDSQLLAAWQHGRDAEAASAALVHEPQSVETLKLLLAQDRIDDAIAVAERILTAQPERILSAVRAIAAENHRFRDQARGHQDALQRIAMLARERLSRLPREDAAHLARQIMMIERRQPSVRGANPFDEALAEFMKEYSGTEEALLSEIDLITRTRASEEQLGRLDAFARAHPGTVAGAKALYTEAFQLAVNIPVTGVEPRGSDPTARLLRVVAMARELESGNFPPCEWVERAPQLVTDFFASNPSFAPGNRDRVAAEYVAFARNRLKTTAIGSEQSGIGYLLTTKLAQLYKAPDDPVPHVEQTLDDMAKETGRTDLSLLKASFYLRMAVEEPARRDAMRVKAKAVLRAASEHGSDVYGRRALATLACLELDDRDLSLAMEHFALYVQRYPDSPYAWVAALHAAASQEASGDWRAAAAAYRAAAARYTSIPLARVIGHEYAARNLEAADKFQDALAEHEQALHGWNPGYGRDYSAYLHQSGAANDPVAFEPALPVTRDALEHRVAQLRASLVDAAGPLLERGRWLLAHERREDARDRFADLLQRFPRSRLADDARVMSHHAQLESALALANVESASPDAAVALAQLTALSRQPYDEAVCVAGIARATLLASDRSDEARPVMRDTLTACRTHGTSAVRSAAPSGLEGDVLAIRNAVFMPTGGGVYGTRGWNAFTWSAASQPFLLVNPAIAVKTADGRETVVVQRDSFPGIDAVVFFGAEQIHMLTSVMTALGGTKRAVPASVMATPNQPAGAAVDIRAFWNDFFPCRQGHWFGWEFEAYPRIGSIEFLDAARTRAAVPVAIGYSGATVVLEKRDGVWHALRLTNEWIT